MRELLRRWGPIAWRDARLAELLGEVRELRSEVVSLTAELGTQAEQLRAQHQDELAEVVREPGFMKQLWVYRREGERVITGAGRGRPHARRGSVRKLRNYAVAASHGVPVPTLYGVWPAVEDVDLDELPNSFVLKSDQGASGRGVFPLRRVGPDRFHLIGGDRTVTSAEVVAAAQAARAARHVRGDWFAEELLPGPSPSIPVPDDVKFYTFYGQVAHAMLRRVPDPRNVMRSSVRYLDADGHDIDASAKHASDTTIPVPDDFAELVRCAQVLSTVHALPFLRVDLYSTPSGVRLGELTPGPGGNHGFAPEHERHLGLLWEEATTRLHQDVAEGVRPLATVAGPHPVPDLLRRYLPA